MEKIRCRGEDSHSQNGLLSYWTGKEHEEVVCSAFPFLLTIIVPGILPTVGPLQLSNGFDGLLGCDLRLVPWKPSNSRSFHQSKYLLNDFFGRLRERGPFSFHGCLRYIANLRLKPR